MYKGRRKRMNVQSFHTLMKYNILSWKLVHVKFFQCNNSAKQSDYFKGENSKDGCGYFCCRKWFYVYYGEEAQKVIGRMMF